MAICIAVLTSSPVDHHFQRLRCCREKPQHWPRIAVTEADALLSVSMTTAAVACPDCFKRKSHYIISLCFMIREPHLNGLLFLPVLCGMMGLFSPFLHQSPPGALLTTVSGSLPGPLHAPINDKKAGNSVLTVPMQALCLYSTDIMIAQIGLRNLASKWWRAHTASIKIEELLREGL